MELHCAYMYVCPIKVCVLNFTCVCMCECVCVYVAGSAVKSIVTYRILRIEGFDLFAVIYRISLQQPVQNLDV